jgi:hypothetical protein
MVSPPKKVSSKRLVYIGAVLLVAACRLPEIILETGGWRAWTGSICAAGGLLMFAFELRDFIRQRRAARRSDQQ